MACGVVYAAACRFQEPLPENPPWWKAFDSEKSAIDKICRVLAHLYSLPKAQYTPVCKDGEFTFSNKSLDSLSKAGPKEVSPTSPQANNETDVSKTAPQAVDVELGGSEGESGRSAAKESKRSDDQLKGMAVDG